MILLDILESLKTSRENVLDFRISFRKALFTPLNVSTELNQAEWTDYWIQSERGSSPWKAASCSSKALYASALGLGGLSTVCGLSGPWWSLAGLVSGRILFFLWREAECFP